MMNNIYSHINSYMSWKYRNIIGQIGLIDIYNDNHFWIIYDVV